MINQLQGVFRCLEKHDVKYVVIGGIASILYGVPRTTFDLDILIEATLENSKKLLKALEESGLGTALLTTSEKILENEITIFQDRVRIDVQIKTPGIEFETAWKNKNTIEYKGQKFHLLSKADLIASKEAAGRPKDLEDVRLLKLDNE
ncbi:MAG TPA: nucleotidyltransferase [Clostridiales bacterium]|nr:nucleotidyltransferase [Clostridiales bacterium]HQP69993.1 nucleotidyltransferase [Clostridiales bacterium]